MTFDTQHVCFGGTLTVPPVPLVAGIGLELFPHVVLAFPASALSGDDPHLLQQGDGDYLLNQHSPCGGERVHVASTAVCCTLSQ